MGRYLARTPASDKKYNAMSIASSYVTSKNKQFRIIIQTNNKNQISQFSPDGNMPNGTSETSEKSEV